MAGRVLIALGAVLLPLACTSGTTGGGGAPDAAGTIAKGDASVGDATGVGSPDALVPERDDAAVDGGVDASVGTSADASLAADGATGDAADATFDPLGIAVMPLQGGNGVFVMTALTLQKGPAGVELYAAVENESDAGILACAPGLTVELYDKSGQPIGEWIDGIDTLRFYDYYPEADAGELASCVAPGDVGMVSFTNLPADLDVDDVGTVVYSTSYWGLPGTQINGLTVTGLTTVALEGGTAFTGTVVSGFDTAVVGPSVQVFPINGAGRPLALATTPNDAGDIPPNGSWTFQTNAVDVPVVGYVAYPIATTLEQSP